MRHTNQIAVPLCQAFHIHLEKGSFCFASLSHLFLSSVFICLFLFICKNLSQAAFGAKFFLYNVMQNLFCTGALIGRKWHCLFLLGFHYKLRVNIPSFNPGDVLKHCVILSLPSFYSPLYSVLLLNIS